MNQNYQSYESDFSRPRRRDAAYYRARAREALRPCYWWALLASFLASLLGGLSSNAPSFEFNSGSSSNSGVKINMSGEELAQNITEAVQTGDFTEVFGFFTPFLMIFLVAFAFALLFSTLFSIFVSSPIKLGYRRYNLNVIDGKGTQIGVLFSYFKRGYGKSIGLNLLYGFIMLLVSLPTLAAGAWFFISVYNALIRDGMAGLFLQVLPSALTVSVVSLVCSILSIVLQYRYAFCFMILAEYPQMGVVSALRSSANLMRGKKWRLFCLRFSFIGWILLTFCTCGIGMFFLIPYMQAADAAFYDDIANRVAAKEAEFPSIDPNDYMA